ncbi:MAG: ATP synthase subunit I [Acidobacteriota bacterium]|nr:ATP synthase subunit I [Acidobacteriota bacterium]
MLENLSPTTLPRLLRRTVLSAIVAGAVGFVIGVMINPLAGLGVVIGVGMAILNLRFLDRQVARVEIKGEQSTKAVRRQLGSNTMGRLAMMTVVAVGALVLDTALGIGIVAGLVIYQIVFVVNVLSVVAKQGDMK